MNQFWPSGLNIEDTSSPVDILLEANNAWTKESKGLLGLKIQKSLSTNNNEMLIVHVKHVPSGRTVTIFSVIHRLEMPYPTTIQPKEGNIPDVLKKSYYKPGGFDLSGGLNLDRRGKTVENEWVCNTPEEFRFKLSEAFNLGFVKSEVLSLLSNKSLNQNDKQQGMGNTEEPDSTSNEVNPDDTQE